MKQFQVLPILTLLLCQLSWADHLPDDIEAGSNVNDIVLPLTKHTAAELAHIETNGKVLSVEEYEENDKKLFRVKVLHNNGKVKIHRFDAQTGHAIH